MILQGKTQQEIANFLELDRSMVSREVKAIREEWKQSSIRDFDEARGQKLAELELVKCELWQAWQESKEQKETTLKERIASLGDGNSRESDKRLKISTRQQTATGDAVYLGGVVNCVKEQAKLLGLYPEETTGGQTIALSEGQISVIGQIMRESHASSD
jgi:predicted transcriptional regulator